MPVPNDGEEALMQAIHTLNSVSVPLGAEFFGGYETQWVAVYDHKNGAVYWRSHRNQNMQRVQLQDMDIARGGSEQKLLVNSSKLQWFFDASSIFQPIQAKVLLV